jgi:hypothetical protein
MSMNENTADFNSAVGKSKPIRSRLHPLHEAAMRLAGVASGAGLPKSRDLVAMLLGHGARAWRSAQPRTHVHLYMTSPSGKRPVRMRLK